jgi:Kef-type K+ transport system membrane component KefB/K+/H+ antiporter YhaU regulatory subunit KhtT
MPMNLLTISFDFDFFPLLIIAAIAWGIPMLMSVLRITKIPTVIVEILTGYFIGKYFILGNPSDATVLLDYFALTGFVFLMFLGGLEIDVDQIIASFPRRKITYARYIKNPLLVGFVYFIITILVSYAAAWAFSFLIDMKNIWYFSLIMVTTSVGIILPILKNRSEVNSPFGQMIVLAAAIADIFSIILFTITAFVLKNGFHSELLWLAALVLLFFVFYLAGHQFKKFKILNQITYQLSHAASQIKIRGTILLILIFVVASQYIEKEVILLGAFLGGLLLSVFMHKERSMLMVKLDGFGYGFFIPIFFIMVGVHFEPDALAELDNSLYVFLALLLVTLFVIKIIPSFLWAKLFGIRRAVAGGFLMSSRLSLIIAAATIGLELGVISEGANASFILMAVATCLISPIIYNMLNPRNIMEGGKTIIVGGSSIGVLLARRLHLHSKSSVIIENNETRFKEIKAKGLTVVKGDGKDSVLFDMLKLNPSNYVVILSGDDDENIRISKMLRKEFQHELMISKAGVSEVWQNLKVLHVETFDATRVIANTIENLIVQPTTYHALVESFDNFHVEEMKMTNKNYDGLQIRELPLHGDGTIMVIRRNDNMYVPHGNTYLRMGDVIAVFGTNTALNDFRKKLNS